MRIEPCWYAIVKKVKLGGIDYGLGICQVGSVMDNVNGWDRWWIKSCITFQGNEPVNHHGGFWMDERDFHTVVGPIEVAEAIRETLEEPSSEGDLKDVTQDNAVDEGLTLEEVCYLLNRATGDDILYCLHETIPGNPLPDVLLQLVKDKNDLRLWRVRDTLTGEAAWGKMKLMLPRV